MFLETQNCSFLKYRSLKNVLIYLKILSLYQLFFVTIFFIKNF